MATQFPLHFTLESGTQVIIRDEGAGQYLFSMNSEESGERQFTYQDGAHTKAEWDEIADFEQLEALRKFWLEMEEVE